jgi:hypothetical protein
MALELILYACPMGELAIEVDRFLAVSRERCGPNAAHLYPPHITLTGFFHDEAQALPLYVSALREAHLAAVPAPPMAITVAKLMTGSFVGLMIMSPWLEAVTAGFAARAASPSRREPLRVKRNLHLSLAYEFAPKHQSILGMLARALVHPDAPVGWELRLYERCPDRSWVTHVSLPLTG